MKEYSKSKEEMFKHEVSHLGLNVEELKTYKELKEKVARASYNVSVSANADTQKQFDIAVEDLVAFEEEHKIKRVKLR